MKIGRVKFAVKEIGYSSDSNKMEVDEKSKNEHGHSANSIFDKPDDEIFEEFEEIDEVIMNADQDDDENDRKCRFCW